MNLPAPVRTRRSVDPKYRLSWTVAGREYSAAIEAHIRPYVDALGIDGAMRLLLEWGGSSVYVANRPQKGGKRAEFLGIEALTALAAAMGGGSRHINFPTANKFIARAMCSRNHSVCEISRRVRRTEMTTRKLLTDPNCLVETGAAS